LVSKKTLKSDPASLELGRGFDPYQKPPDLEMAVNHGKAKRVYRPKQSQDLIPNIKEICPCCGLQIKGELIPLTASLKEMYHLGSGYVLFFLFLKYSIGLLLFILAISGIYNLVTSSRSDDCQEESDQESKLCMQGFIGSLTIANKRYDIDSITVQLILNLASVVAVIFFFHYMRFKFRAKVIDVDNRTITPADFTIIIRGVAEDITNEKIADWIESLATKDNDLEIKKIHRSYDIKEYIKYANKKHSLVKQRDQQMYQKNLRNVQIIQNKIEQVERSIDELKKHRFIYAPVVFVTFKKASDAEYLHDQFQKSLLRRLIEYCADILFNPKSDLGQKRIELSRAPEPSDVLWENLTFTLRTKFWTRIITRLTTLLAIALGFGVIFLIYWGQNRAIERFGSNSSIVQLVSISASIAILIVNSILSVVIRFFINNEKYSTFTRYSCEITKKLLLAQIFNTAFTPLIAKVALSVDFSSIVTAREGLQGTIFYGKGGLLESMYYIFIINAIVPPIMTILHPFRIIKHFKRKMLINKKQESTLTQYEAHKLFEEPIQDFPSQYVVIIKSMLLASFYFTAMPIVCVFSIAGLILFYWANKVAFLRLSGLPQSTGDEFVKAIIPYLEWMAFMIAAGNAIFIYVLNYANGEPIFNDSTTTLLWITVGISLFHTIVPMDWLNRSIFKIKDQRADRGNYDEARMSFYTDYDIENPLTRRIAISEFLSFIRNKKHTKLKRMKSRAQTTAFDKLKVEDIMKAFQADAAEESNNVDYSILDDYANEIRKRTPLTQSKDGSLVDIHNLRLAFDDCEGLQTIAEEMETITHLVHKARWGKQSKDLNHFSDYYKRLVTKDLRDIPSILKNAMSTMTPHRKSQDGNDENQRAKIEKDSLIKALKPHDQGLAIRNQETVFEFKDLADISVSEKENNCTDASQIQINYTEIPLFIVDRSKFDLHHPK